MDVKKRSFHCDYRHKYLQDYKLADVNKDDFICTFMAMVAQKLKRFFYRHPDLV